MKIKRYDPRHILQAIGFTALMGGKLDINRNKELDMITIRNDELDAAMAAWRGKDLDIIQVHPSAPTVPYVRIIVKERKQ